MGIVYFLIPLFLFINNTALYAQVKDVPPAEFDVIVKVNGEIIYGKIVEVSRSTELIRYKRTDIPDGPIYELFWSEVYAISYRNQLTEYFLADDAEWRSEQPHHPHYLRDDELQDMEEDEFWYSEIRAGQLRVGFGAIRQYSRVSEVDNYRERSGFPAMDIAYLFPLHNNIELGTIISWASFRYSERSFSDYDQIRTNRDITETLLTFGLVGRYYVDLDFLRPYILSGVSYTNSRVRTEGRVTFTDDERSVLIQGGARSGSFGIPVRVGFDIRLTSDFGLYMDVGNGLTLLQIGGTFNL